MHGSNDDSSFREELNLGQSLRDVIDELKRELGNDYNEARFQLVRRKPAGPVKRQYPSMDPAVLHAVREVIGVGRDPYSHQIDAWHELHEGRSVLLTTPTASGKTMCYNPVILDRVMKDDASALYVFPLVDLATSQASALGSLIGKLPRTAKVGQMPAVSEFHSSSQENWEQRTSGKKDFVLTTPESLHQTLLPNSYPNWRSFFNRLRFVVLDEAHVYSGVFGTNMAFILRRLAHRCLREGGQLPQFVVCTATIQDPVGFSRNLLPPETNSPTLIDKTGAASPERTEVAFLSKRKSVVDLFIRLLKATFLDESTGKSRPVRTILFVRSRRAVTEIEQAVKSALQKEGSGELAARFCGYMANAPNARDVFQRLQTGQLQSIITTNKLMAGIDIGDLDVSIVYRFQRRFLDMRQMFGRAGRKGTGAWIFIGDPNSLEDQYILDSFPEAFRCRDPEATIVSLSNTFLRDAHLRCVNGYVHGRSHKQEGPAQLDLVQRFFGTSASPSGTSESPWSSTPLNGLQIRGSNVRANYRLVIDGIHSPDEEATEVPQAIAFRDYHPGAVFELEGRTYVVTRLVDRPKGQIEARSTTLPMRTYCQEVVQPTCLKLSGRETRRGFEIALGEYQIKRSFRDYDVLEMSEKWECPRKGCDHNSENRGKCPNHKCALRYTRTWKKTDHRNITPPLEIPLETVGVELDLKLPVESFDRSRRALQSTPLLPYGLNSNGLLKGLSALIINSFEDAFLVEGEILGAIINPPCSLILYDDFPGGIGVVREIFDNEAKEQLLWRKALQRVLNCKCKSDQGCMKCILPQYSPKDEAPKKELVIRFLKWFLSGRAKSAIR